MNCEEAASNVSPALRKRCLRRAESRQRRGLSRGHAWSLSQPRLCSSFEQKNKSWHPQTRHLLVCFVLSCYFCVGYPSFMQL